MTPRPTQDDVIAWANKRREVDLVSKTILRSLAYFMQEDGDTWATVAKLADEANCSVRTAQYRLRALEEAGYLRDTGRTHRLKGSTRSVPLYQLGPVFAWEDEILALAAVAEASPSADPARPSMGANPAPIDGAWVQDSQGMGATVCTRIDHLESPDIHKGAGAPEREDLEEAYRRVAEVYPTAGMRWTDPGAARAALADLLGQGVAVADLVAAARECAADPLLRKPTFRPVALQRWLGEGRWRHFLPRPAAAAPKGSAGAATDDAPWTGPDTLRAQILAELGEAFAVNLARCGWAEGRLTTPTTWTFDKLKPLAGLIAEHGGELVAPSANPGGNR